MLKKLVGSEVTFQIIDGDDYLVAVIKGTLKYECGRYSVVAPGATGSFITGEIFLTDSAIVMYVDITS